MTVPQQRRKGEEDLYIPEGETPWLNPHLNFRDDETGDVVTDIDPMRDYTIECKVENRGTGLLHVQLQCYFAIPNDYCKPNLWDIGLTHGAVQIPSREYRKVTAMFTRPAEGLPAQSHLCLVACAMDVAAPSVPDCLLASYDRVAQKNVNVLPPGTTAWGFRMGATDALVRHEGWRGPIRHELHITRAKGLPAQLADPAKTAFAIDTQTMPVELERKALSGLAIESACDVCAKVTPTTSRSRWRIEGDTSLRSSVNMTLHVGPDARPAQPANSKPVAFMYHVAQYVHAGDDEQLLGGFSLIVPAL